MLTRPGPSRADIDDDLTIDDHECVDLFKRLLGARRQGDHQGLRRIVNELRSMGWACFAVERAGGDR